MKEKDQTLTPATGSSRESGILKVKKSSSRKNKNKGSTKVKLSVPSPSPSLSDCTKQEEQHVTPEGTKPEEQPVAPEGSILGKSGHGPSGYADPEKEPAHLVKGKMLPIRTEYTDAAGTKYVCYETPGDNDYYYSSGEDSPLAEEGTPGGSISNPVEGMSGPFMGDPISNPLEGTLGGSISDPKERTLGDLIRDPSTWARIFPGRLTHFRCDVTDEDLKRLRNFKDDEDDLRDEIELHYPPNLRRRSNN